MDLGSLKSQLKSVLEIAAGGVDEVHPYLYGIHLVGNGGEVLLEIPNGLPPEGDAPSGILEALIFTEFEADIVHQPLLQLNQSLECFLRMVYEDLAEGVLPGCFEECRYISGDHQ